MDLGPKTHQNVTLKCGLSNPLPSRRDILDAFDRVFNDWLPEVKDGGPYHNTTALKGVKLSIDITKGGSKPCSVDAFNRLLRELKLEALDKANS